MKTRMIMLVTIVVCLSLAPSDALCATWMCCDGSSLSTGEDLDWCGWAEPEAAAGLAVAEWWAAGQFPNPDDVTCGPFSPPPVGGVVGPESGDFYFFRCSGRARVMLIPPMVIPLRWSGYRSSIDQAFEDALREWDAMCSHEVWACVVIVEETFCYHSSLL